MVEGGGFEPPKASPTDLQSAPFSHSGTPPLGAGDGTRTRNLLITNQLLCQVELRQQQEMAYSHTAFKLQAKKAKKIIFFLKAGAERSVAV